MGLSQNCKCPKTFSYLPHIKVHYISDFVYLSAYSRTLNRSKKIKDASLRAGWSWPSISHYFCIFFFFWNQCLTLSLRKEAVTGTNWGRNERAGRSCCHTLPCQTHDLKGPTWENLYKWLNKKQQTTPFAFTSCQRKMARFQKKKKTHDGSDLPVSSCNFFLL